MNKHNLDWLRDMHSKDTEAPTSCVEGEKIYTIFMSDFLKMPDVNFFELATVDTHVRALLN